MAALLTFGDAKFEWALQRIEREAASSTFFDEQIVTQPADLGARFWERHGDFVRTNSRGFGYWLWKPWIILEQLSQRRPGDIIVYADAGCTINPAGRKRFDEYLEIARESPTGTMGFQMKFPEKRYTKGDAFEALKAWHLKDTGHLSASVGVFVCCNKSIELVRDWLAAAEDYSLISDAPSRVPNDESFVVHRHDQSLYSLVSKLRGGALIDEETYHRNWDDAVAIPIWTTRHRKRPKLKRRLVKGARTFLGW
jgi:hypothetical protein